ncbi:hypothetical protein C8F04DRAFT_1254171 [Mycena alexandri]|uniref:Homeobox domain-containing protein n=1 Tax=Mycena alexandri TaxID=1745969 RepID=A0AAD6T6P0_9AGAR|nr:hypothetical protein C8F04DRAFT_1254171 [Mycena alexandri]
MAQVADTRWIDMLRTIHRTGSSIKDRCSPSPITLNPPNPPSLPTVTLPAPTSIHAKLLDLGLDSSVVDVLSSSYARRCEELHMSCQNGLRRALQDLANVPRHPDLVPLSQWNDRLVSVSTSRYLKALRALEERALKVASNWKGQEPKIRPTPKKERPVFNSEFTPFLQKYFEYNAYPSTADRAAMAKKSLMEPRQIAVWFQNHRRRARGEGQDLRRTHLLDPVPLDMCMKSLEEEMATYMIPVGLRQSADDHEVSEAGSEDEEDDEDFDNEPEVVDISNVLNPPAARHAYPVKFKDSRNMASTILWTQQFSFPAPVWPRKASKPAVKRPVVTIEECTDAFACLHVRDSRNVLSPPFQSATTVIPATAPLPSLVRDKFVFSKVLATTSLNPVPAPPSRRHPFRSPSPYAQPAALAPTAPRRKKVAGPPRRTPKRAANYRGASPATSETSTMRSVSPPSRFSSFAASSPPSRTPSLESSGFSPSRTPSFGSSGFSSRSSSSSSSGPTTPTGSPSALPLEIANFDVFGDSYASSSPVDEAPQHGKQPQHQFEFAFARYASH